MEELKKIYKQLPKQLLRNKWELRFMVSHKIYCKIKDKLHNGRFLGIEVCADNMYLN